MIEVWEFLDNISIFSSELCYEWSINKLNYSCVWRQKKLKNDVDKEIAIHDETSNIFTVCKYILVEKSYQYIDWDAAKTFTYDKRERDMKENKSWM